MNTIIPSHGRQTTPEMLARDARGLTFPSVTTPTKQMVPAAQRQQSTVSTDSPLFSSSSQTTINDEERVHEAENPSTAQKVYNMTTYGLSKTVDGTEGF